MGTHLGNGLTDSKSFVTGEVVHDDHVARTKRGNQLLSNVCQEYFPIDGPINHQRSRESRRSQRCQERRRFPMAMRNFIDQSCSDKRTATRPRHVRFRPCFIDEYQLIRIDSQLPNPPSSTLGGNIRSILLGRLQDFFFKVNLRCFSAMQSVDRAKEVANFDCNSDNVRSGCRFMMDDIC